MKTFLRICRFEQKKLLQKTYIRAAIGLILILTLALNIYPLLQETEIAYLDDDGNVVIETVNQIQEAALERKFAKAYNGMLLTNDVLTSIREYSEPYYDEVTTEESGRLPLMNIYLPYRSVGNLGLDPLYESEVLADETYEHIQENWQEYLQAERGRQILSDQEVEYWTAKLEELSWPLTMYYADGYVEILKKAYWLGLLGLGFAILCLCPAFSEETACRTDSLIRTSRSGDRKVSVAKLAAGETTAAGMLLLLYGVTAAIQFAVHGAGGAEASMQLQERLNDYVSGYCYSMTVGQAFGIILAVSLLLILAAGSLTMLLSRLLRRTVPVLAAPFCFTILLPYVVDYYCYRKPGVEKILSYFPLQRLKVGDLLIDARLTGFCGVTLTARQTSLLLYGGLTILFLMLCVILCRITAVERQ